jgi:AraC-like DNA-binding protein
MSLIYLSIFSELIFFVFSLVLFLKKSPIRNVNRRLAITFMLMSGYSSLMVYLHYAQRSQSYTMLSCYFHADIVVGMLMCPAIFFYVCSLFNYPFILKKIWVHALPLIPALAFVVYFATLPVGVRVEWLLSDYGTLSPVGTILNTIFYFQILVYIVLCLRMVSRQRSNAYLLQVSGNQTDIRWLHYFFLIAFGVLLVAIPVCIGQNCDAINTRSGMLVVDILVFYLFIKSVWKTGLIMQLCAEIQNTYERSFLLDDELCLYYLKILNSVMDNNRTYFPEEYSIKDLADETGISQRHLSFILNTRLNKNFHDYINGYRVDHACQLLSNVQRLHYTLEAVGRECGFGSRSNFTRVFMKHTGQSPSQFRKKMFESG